MHLAAALHATVGVGVRALLLHVRAGGKDHVGELGRLGEEDVLHDEELERRKRLADLVDVGVRQEGVLAHHVHPADPAVEHRVHDLGDGQAPLRIQVAVPHRLEALARLGGIDRLVVGIEHRDQPRVGGALHVVLAAQRVKAGAGVADLAGDRAQGDQAAGVVGARRVLRDAHPPVHDRALGLAPEPRDLSDRGGVDATDLGDALGRIVLDQLGELGVVRRALRDELAVDQPELDDLVHHAVVERDVGARLDLAEDVGVVGDALAAHVDHHQLGAASTRLLEERRCDRVVGGRVGAGEDGDVGVDDVAVGRRHRTRPDALEQRGDARGVAQPRAVVDVVGAEAGADQLLEEVGLLVGALRRAEAGDRLADRARSGSAFSRSATRSSASSQLASR